MDLSKDNKDKISELYTLKCLERTRKQSRLSNLKKEAKAYGYDRERNKKIAQLESEIRAIEKELDSPEETIKKWLGL